MSATDEPVVLVVEDEPDVGETYELWLAGEYEVRRAATGTEALDALDEDVDVVLLDRMLPGMSGKAVLSELRDRGHDAQVAMVTAVDPDFDIVEMGFDAYVTKPPTRETLVETITDLLERGERAGRVRGYHSLLAKRAALEGGKSETELAESDAYAELQARIAALEDDLEADEDRLLDDSEFVGALRDFEESDR
jgi:DNA-binding response OmpR family regulator